MQERESGSWMDGWGFQTDLFRLVHEKGTDFTASRFLLDVFPKIDVQSSLLALGWMDGWLVQRGRFS